MPPQRTLWSDRAETLLAVCETAFDPADLPERRFVAGGPGWAHDLCSFLVVHPVLVATSSPIVSNRERLQPLNDRPSVRQLTFAVTLVSNCQPIAKPTSSRNMGLPTPDAYTAAALDHIGFTEDLFRTVSAAVMSNEIWEGCQQSIADAVSWNGPDGAELWSQFTVVGDCA